MVANCDTGRACWRGPGRFVQLGLNVGSIRFVQISDLSQYLDAAMKK